jgi:hypothetical protein
MASAGGGSANLSLLRHLLNNLPSNIPLGSTHYSFNQFKGLDPDWVENTGSNAGALNHELEIMFGSWHAGSIQFHEQGPSLTAVVDVLATYITGMDKEEAILMKWVEDLIAGAHTAFLDAGIEVFNFPFICSTSARQ